MRFATLARSFSLSSLSLLLPLPSFADDGLAWTKLDPVLPGRAWYSMAPLPNDSAIACFGGRSGGDWDGTTSCDIYDPIAMAWSPGPDLPAGASPRLAGIAVPLPDGKVLYCGGMSGNKTYGSSLADYLVDCYLYDPAANAWTRTGDLPADSRFLSTECNAVVLNDGRVLVCGGAQLFKGGPSTIAASALFDPGTGGWTATPPMNVRRFHFGAPVLLPSGRVLVCGGYSVPGPYAPTVVSNHTDTAEIYDPLANTWTFTDPLPLVPSETSASGTPIDPSFGSRRAFHGTIALPNGKVLVIGGSGAFPDFRCRSGCLLFDETEPAGSKWSSIGNSLGAHAVAWARRNDALPGHRVLVFGGVDEFINNTVFAEEFDPATNQWSHIADLPLGNSGLESNTTSQMLFNLFEGDMYATVLTSGNVVLAYGHSNTATGHFVPSSDANDAVAILAPTPAPGR
jgi:hypothetical protein